jgi:hypothetical protein
MVDEKKTKAQDKIKAQIDEAMIKGYKLHNEMIRLNHAQKTLEQQFEQNQVYINQLESKLKE